MDDVYSFAVNSNSVDFVDYSSQEGAALPELEIEFIPGNQPPIANAGPDQTVTDNDNNGSEIVTLDGSSSLDPDGSIVSYIWSEEGNQIATGVNPVITLSVGVHNIDLTVTDDLGATDTDQVIITVNPPPPVTLTFTPTDDATVRLLSPISNFGAFSLLRAATTGEDEINSYLKFNVTGINGPVSNAKIRLQVTNASDDGGSMFSVSNDYQSTTTPWDEHGIKDRKSVV